MARVRQLDPGFFTNEELVELSFEYRLLFAGLWTIADREGRLEDRPKRIRMALFPCDDVDVDAGLQRLHAAGLVHRYVVDDVRYLCIPKFLQHQKPHPRETASVIPPPAGKPRAGQGDTQASPIHDEEGEPEARLRQTKGGPKADQGCAKVAGLSDSRTLGLSEDGEEQETRAPRRTPAARGVRIPDGFPSEAEFDWCRANRPELDPLRVGQVFRDHHIAHGSTMKDWRAAWRTWVGKERAPYAPRASPAAMTASERRTAFVASLTGRSPATATDSRTIDVNATESAAPRIAIGGG